jgi:hypothetical protein
MSITISINRCDYCPRFLVLIGDLWGDSDEATIVLECIDEEDLVYSFNNSFIEITFYSHKECAPYPLYVNLLTVTKSDLLGDLTLETVFKNVMLKIYNSYTSNDAISYPLYQILQCFNVSTESYNIGIIWKNYSIYVEFLTIKILYNGEIMFTNEFVTRKNTRNNKRKIKSWKIYLKKLLREIEDDIAPEIFYTGLSITRVKRAQ